METIKGERLNKFPINDLVKVADLIYFNGPLLSQFIDRKKQNFLYYWCDCDPNVNRWLIFPVLNLDLQGYLEGEKSLYDLIINNDSFSKLFVADIDNNVEFQSVWEVSILDLPDSYIPERDSFYEFTPEYRNVDHKEIPARRFFQRLIPEYQYNIANSAFASQKAEGKSTQPLLLSEASLDKELIYKVFFANNIYEILIQSFDSRYNDKIVLLGVDEETISLLAVLSDNHEVYDGYVSNLYYKEDFPKSDIKPLIITDMQTLSFYFENEKISEASIKDSIKNSATNSGISSWRRIAGSENISKTLKNSILKVLKELK